MAGNGRSKAKRRILPYSQGTAMVSMKHASGITISSSYGKLSLLSEAAEKGDIKNLQEILNNKKLNINDVDLSGQAAIHKAIKCGNLDVVRLLLQHPKLDINVLSKDGFAPIHLAVKLKRSDILELLLSHNAKVGLQDVNGKTALHIAARKANKELLEVLLLHQGVNVNIESRDLATPLHSAVTSGSYEICQLLINSGGNVYKADIGSQTPLILAAAEKHSDILQLIIRTAQAKPALFESYLHHKDHEGSNALHIAVVNNQYENVKLLLKAGANVNYPKEDNSTALHIAAMFGFNDIGSLLIKNGADVDHRNNKKQTPLHRAAAFDNKSQFAQLVIANGADINSVDHKGMTPLHHATQKARLEMIQFLIDKGAKIDVTDDFGKSILHHSVESGQLTCLELLMQPVPKEKVTAILNGIDMFEMTALHHCSQSGQLDFVEKLLEMGASPAAKDELDKTPIHLAAEHGHPACIAALFNQSKSEINDDDFEGHTPMLLACFKGHYSSVKTLLRFGGDVAARGRDETNHTALTAAASKGHLEIVDLLLENGADIHASTKYRDTALHLACRGNHLKIVDLLLKNSANVSARNLDDSTPLDMAIENRSEDAAAAIIGNDSWVDAMENEDKSGTNPFPKLVAFMPSVAKMVLDNCVSREGDPDSEDFSLTYNFKYIDPHPDSPCCKSGKAWYANDMAEHAGESLLTHELTDMNMIHKWMKFARISLIIDFIYYLSVVIILSVFIDKVPKEITDYEDLNGCPMLVTEEEVNNATVFARLQENGTLDRFEKLDAEQQHVVQILQISVIFVIVGTIIRLGTSLICLRLMFFKNASTYTTVMIAVCVVTALTVDTNSWVMCNYQWRAAWIGVLLSWGMVTQYLIRIPVIGLYVTMFLRVVYSVVMTMAVLFIFFVAFAFCFSITQHRKAEFSSPAIGFISTLAMALGEISFVERFVDANTGPFRVDNLILISMFMIVIPIALINLLIGVAVGDIDSVKGDSRIRSIMLRIKTIDEYQRYSIKWFLRRAYEETVTIYPNRLTGNFILKVAQWCLRRYNRATKRSVYQRSRGWEYHSRLQPVVDTVKVLADELEASQHRMRKMEEVINQQNEWLLAIAGKLGAELDQRGKHIN